MLDTNSDNFDEIKCDYCSTRQAVIKFKNGKYCCSEKVQGCPGWRNDMKETLQKSKHVLNSKRRQININLSEGKYKCKYCGRPAMYIVSLDIPCCQSKASLCSNYKTWLSKNMTKYYTTVNKKKLSRIKKKVHNRPSVIKSKRKKMLELHRGDSEEAKDFQKSYEEGRNKFRDDLKNKKER